MYTRELYSFALADFEVESLIIAMRVVALIYLAAFISHGDDSDVVEDDL